MVAIQVAINNPRTSAANPSPYAIHTQTLVVDRPSSPETETERFHLQSDASAWDAQISISSSQRASTEPVDRPSDGRSKQTTEAHATDAEDRIVKLEQQIVSMIASASTSPPKVIEPPSPKAAAVSTDSAILFRHLKTIRAILASQPSDPGAQGVGGCVVYEHVDISGVSIGIASSGKKTERVSPSTTLTIAASYAHTSSCASRGRTFTGRVAAGSSTTSKSMQQVLIAGAG